MNEQSVTLTQVSLMSESQQEPLTNNSRTSLPTKLFHDNDKGVAICLCTVHLPKLHLTCDGSPTVIVPLAYIMLVTSGKLPLAFGIPSNGCLI